RARCRRPRGDLRADDAGDRRLVPRDLARGGRLPRAEGAQEDAQARGAGDGVSLDRTSVMAISLHGPYAQLVACGLKTIETRAHRTHHRGPLLICSTLTLDVAARDRIAKIVYACTAESDEKYLRPLLAHGFELERPAGMALALVDVVGCRPLLPEDEPAAWFYAPG